MKQFPPFRLDTVNQCLWRHRDNGDDERISLTPKAFGVLRYLVEHSGRLVTQNELLEALWPDTFVQPEVIKSHILDIRAALGDRPKNPHFIETLPRRGYRFIAPISDVSTESTISLEPATGTLVGRSAELGRLGDSLQMAWSGRRQIVFVTGEPGIGKTALVDEFQRRLVADLSGVRIARGQCVEGYGGKEAYYPLLEALGQVFRGPTGDSLVGILEKQAPTLLVQFPAFIRPEHREMLQQEIMGATRQRMLREISEALETIASERLLLLVFEDLHWVDHSTVDLIAALARRRQLAKLMLICTYRPVDVALSDHPLKTLKRELVIHELVHEIALEPLQEPEIAEYLATESEGVAVPEGLAGLIHRRTEGNPLFMVAILKHMREQKLMAQDNAALTLTVSLQEVELRAPESLRQMIESQIERLSDEQRRALEAASVAGVLFSTAVSATAANMDADDFEHLCEGLLHQHQLVRSAEPQEFPDRTASGRYEFAHTLYREAFYRLLAPGRRTELHRRTGERLEELFSAGPGEVAPELAHHFEESRDWSRAIKYLRLMAETAGRRYAPREAAGVLQHAVELSRKLPEAERAAIETEILTKLAGIYLVSFDMRVVETCEVLAVRAAHYGLIDVEIRALVDMAYPLSWISSERCLKVLERALELSTRQKDPLMRATTLARCLVRRIWAGGWNARDADECRRAVAEIRQAGDRLLLACHLIDYNFIQWVSSEYREAQSNAVQSLAILLNQVEENPYLSTPIWQSQFILPWSLLFLGEWGETLREIKVGIAMADRNGDSYRAQTLHLFQAWLHLEAMDFAGAVEICDSVLPSLGDPPRRPWRRSCLALLGSAHRALGNYGLAREHLFTLRDEMDHHTVIHDWHHRMVLQSALAELWFARGDLQQARAETEKYLDVTQVTAERTYQARAWEMSARVAMAELDMTGAQDSIAKGLATMEGFEVPLASWRVHAVAAELHGHTQDGELAEYHLALSREMIMKLANSLPAQEPLRKAFLSDPGVRKVLGDATIAIGLRAS
jgi:DNA-binding winged helix-turn-helix (wHTH) protein/tetratricopeptide (TPR) repeat protein